MFIIVSKYLLPKGYRGMTLFPFVLLKYRADSEDAVLLNHERIHLRQQLELLIVPFFLWYAIEFLIRFLLCGNKQRAYRSLSFEREAYANEKDLRYLKQRPFYRFVYYL